MDASIRKNLCAKNLNAYLRIRENMLEMIQSNSFFTKTNKGLELYAIYN